MFIAAAIVLILIAFAMPLAVRASDIPPEEPVSPTQHLDDRKASIYENMRDLLAEFQMGKMSEADYQESKGHLQKELSGVLAEIERVLGDAND